MKSTISRILLVSLFTVSLQSSNKPEQFCLCYTKKFYLERFTKDSLREDGFVGEFKPDDSKSIVTIGGMSNKLIQLALRRRVYVILDLATKGPILWSNCPTLQYDLQKNQL